MGEWRTLHFFDDKKFISKVAPMFKMDHRRLADYIDSDFGKDIVFGRYQTDELATQIIDYCGSLSDDLRTDANLVRINRPQQPGEKYGDYISSRNSERESYLRDKTRIIGELCRLLSLVVFSECALFNPHVKMGKRLFYSYVGVEENSIAGEATSIFNYHDMNTIFAADLGRCRTPINWITHEEVQLLWMDRHHIHPTEDEYSHPYYQDFMHFLEVALQHELGLISCLDMDSYPFASIPAPFAVNIDRSKIGLHCIIEDR